MESRSVRRSQESGPPIPSGTVTFAFSDIEGSTTRWERFPDAMREAVRVHDAILRASIERHGGHVFKTVGDAFCVAFARPGDAIAAALDAQTTLGAADFSAVDGIRVRMAIHLGTTDERDGDYFGPPVNRVARLVAIGHGGQTIVSQIAAEMAMGSLPPGAILRDLGEHRLKDLTIPERVFQLVVDGLPAEFPALRSLSVLRNNLPLQLSPLVGREAMVREVVEALATSRLVSLLGAGGIGKTRLALQAGAEIADSMPDGIWFVDLAPLASDAHVADAILAALGVVPASGRSAAESALQYLRSRDALLVIDNCEHLVAGVASIVEAIVRNAPGIAILATTREPLALSGETVLRIPSLALPPPGPLAVDEALRYGAVALFVARAHAADARFELTAESAPIVGEIVRRLDGIALAIELAAARVTVLSLASLARRLDERFRVLTGGSRTALPRQRTMRALMDWSWDLLCERDRTILRRSSLFAGGWTIEAAESVCADDDFDALDVVDAIGSLVDKSLVANELDERARRNRLLETTRAYALEKLDQSGEREAIALRHATWVAAFCERLHGSYDASPAWFAEVEAELDNARAALRWSIANDRVEIAARIVLRAVCGYWWFRAPREGLDWAQQILARVDCAALPVVAGALHALCGSYRSDRAGLVDYERSVEILTPLAEAGVELAPYTRLTYCLGGLGNALLAAGRTSEAREAVERGIALYERAGEARSRGYANVLANLASILATEGEFGSAGTTFDAARTLFAALDETPGVALVAMLRARAEFAAGDVRAARTLASEATAIYDAHALVVGAVEALSDGAAYAYALGELEEARRLVSEAMERAAGARLEPLPSALATVASLATDAGDRSSVTQIVGFLAALERREERPLEIVGAALRDRLVLRLDAAPGSLELMRDAADVSSEEIVALARTAIARFAAAP